MSRARQRFVHRGQALVDRAVSAHPRSITPTARRAHRSHAFVYGSDPEVVAHGYAEWTLWHLGFPARSQWCLDTALSLARELAHPLFPSYKQAIGSHDSTSA
jgi:hypothetical protein